MLDVVADFTMNCANQRKSKSSQMARQHHQMPGLKTKLSKAQYISENLSPEADRSQGTRPNTTTFELMADNFAKHKRQLSGQYEFSSKIGQKKQIRKMD